MKKLIHGYRQLMSVPGTRPILRAMRLTVLLLTVFCLQVAANSFAQVTFSGQQVALEKVFDAIKRQTDYHLVYGQSDLKDTKPVNITVKNVPVQDILEKALKDQPLEYSIIGQNIFIRRKVSKSGNTETSIVFEQTPLAVKINGVVLNQNNDPVPGATITEKGTNNATSTAGDGTFSMIIAKAEGTLVVTGANIDPYELKIKGQTTIVAVVTMKISKLDEIQVVAYGTNTQRFQVGSVTKVTSEEISRQPVGNPLAALMGKVPGMVVTQSNGMPGSSVSVRIRGQNSLKPKTSGNVLFDNPLYIINGVPFAPQNNFVNQYSSLYGNGASASAGSPGYSPFNSINPSDIESVEVLRDADATAIYGSRGSNGVVLITTKKGKAGKSSVKFNIYTGQSEVTRTKPLMNVDQYRAMRKQAITLDGGTPNLTPFDPGYAPDLLVFDSTRNVDWKKEFMGNTGRVLDANVALSGGSENTQYLLGAGYRTEQFLFPGDAKNTRMSVNANIHHGSRNKKFNIDFNANYSYDLSQSSQNNSLLKAYLLPPNYPELLQSNGDLVWNYKGIDLDNLSSNPFAYLKQGYRVKNYNLLSNVAIGYEVLPGLMAKASLGFNNFSGNEYRTYPRAGQNPINNPLGRAEFGRNDYQSWVIEPQLDYIKNVLGGKLSVTIGGTFQKNTNTSTSASGTRYTNDLLLGTITGAGTATVTDASSMYKYSAAFGRIGYVYDGKYILSLTGRRDGSSRFGPDRQFGNFGSVGGGWIFSQENFIKEFLPFLSFGKLRGSYGTTGNDNVGNYQYIAPFSPVANVNYQGSVGYVPVNLYNPDFSWAITKKAEVGLELGFFNDKIITNLTYFQNRSDNQLVQYSLPIQTGFRSVTKNAPYTVQNKGLEFSIAATLINNKYFTWSSSFNFALPNNKLVKFDGIAASPYKDIYVVGRSLTVLRKFVYRGVNDTTGMFEFVDVDKNGKLQANSDFTAQGDLDENFYGGFSNTFNYKGLQVDIFFQFNQSRGENYLGQIYGYYPVGYSNNLPTVFENTWTQKGSNAILQRLTSNFEDAYTAGTNFAASNSAYSDASFIRLKNVAVSYSFPKKIIDRLGLQTLRVFMNAQNLFTITNYPGNDPETKSYYSLPPLRTITAGINITL